MRANYAFPILALCAGFAALAGLAPGADEKKQDAPKFTSEQLAYYDKQVKPILQQHCLKCHSADAAAKKKLRGGLRLDSRAALLKGGDTGPAIDVKKLDASLFLKAINHKDDLEMPPSGKLPKAELDVLTKWVMMGAPFPPGKDEGNEPARKVVKITDEDRNWWAYRPVKRPDVPAVKDSSWPTSPIDNFILAKIEAKGLRPAAPADRVALLRRAYYDLTGLPPTPEEIDAFVSDKAPDAFAKVVDKLLASPAYGEKWGRHWLDLVRFAETHGYERDSVKPFAWRYRDYVIEAFNDDTSYDRFLTEQLAGDELDDVTTRSMTATGYYRLGLWDDEPADRVLAPYDVLDGIVSTTSQVMMGTTVGCARCHDHKKDPVPQRDYYRLLAFFHDVTPMDRTNLKRVASDEARHLYERREKQRRQSEGKLYAELYQLEQKFIAELAAKKKIDASRLVGNDLTDLTYRFYRDTWDKLPDFDSLKAEETGKVASNAFSLAPASRSDAIGLVFEGKLKVPQKGEYVFAIDSTDGARLILDGKRVIDAPNKGAQKAEGKARLSAGLVPIRLEYFNTYSKPRLKVTWKGPGVGERALSEDVESERSLVADSRKAGVEWRYTVDTLPGGRWREARYDDSGWKKGPGGFGRKGTPGGVVRTNWHTSNIWIRKKFTVDQLPTSLALDVHHDEDVVVWLNGTIIYRDSGFLLDYKRVPLDDKALKALKVGDNVLAALCLQTVGGQYVDLGLVASTKADLVPLVREHGKDVLGEEGVKNYLALRGELEAVRRKAEAPPGGVEVMCVSERGPMTTRVLIRGNPHVPGDVVTAGVPEVLSGEATKLTVTKKPTSSGKRLALAKWLTDKQNPTTARVMVNRLWQFHFGRGLCPTPSDFGKLGELPTHPELIDYLADEFMKGDWQIKRMHRMLMLSSAYQTSSKPDREALAKDPANALFWRFNLRRLTAEEVRDSMLLTSGQLTRRMAGPGVYPKIPQDVLAGQSRPGDGWGKSPPAEASRRSVYVHVKRSLIVPILQNHDLADTDSSCAVRYVTTVPTQALGMLNGEFTNEQAALFAERLLAEAPDRLDDQVRRAIRLTTGRAPMADEVKKDVAFVKELRADEGLDAKAALTAYCLLALNANEFIYLD